MSDASGTGCRRNAWAVAAAGGALVALMLMFVAKFAFLKALVIGAVLALALGLILVWAFCSQTEESRAATVATPAPKPEPAATERKPEAVEPQAEPRTVAARPVPAAKPVAAKRNKVKPRGSVTLPI